MANVIKTVITYPLNGSTRDFNIPFEYLARKFIQVTLIGRDRKPLTNIDDYRFTSKNQITTNRAWGTGDGYQLIELRRFTSATERLVDFSDGSILRAYDLNVSQIQTLHVAEEARDLTADTIGVNNDGDLDARGRRIVNLADPVNEMDAVNLKTIKEWNNGAYQSYLKAKEEAEKAARSATAAKTSETNAYSHMTQAGISEQRSKASETSAENSKNAAAASAQSAAQSAGSASNSAKEATGAKEYTKQQADRSYNEAERAKGYADSMGNSIDIGKTIESINTSTNEVIWKGVQLSKEVGIGYPRVPGVASPASRFGYHNDTSKTPRLFMTDPTGGVTLTFPWETGTFATREWVNGMIVNAGATLNVRQPGSSNVMYINSDSNCGFWSTSLNTSTLSINGSGDVRVYGQFQSSGNLSVTGYQNANKNDYAGIFMASDGRVFFSQYIGGSWRGEINFPKTTGTFATEQWVNSQGFVKTSGTKLGPVVTGNAVVLQSRDSSLMTVVGFEELMSQVPWNAVFCGVTFSNSGSLRAGAPKWRVITG